MCMHFICMCIMTIHIWMRHILLMKHTWHSYVYACHSYVYYDDTHISSICVCMSFICVLWWYTYVIHMCIMMIHINESCIHLHPHSRHDSFTCVTWLIHMCDMTHSHVWHDSEKTCVYHNDSRMSHDDTLMNESRTHRHSLLRHDSFIRVTWLMKEWVICIPHADTYEWVMYEWVITCEWVTCEWVISYEWVMYEWVITYEWGISIPP